MRFYALYNFLIALFTLLKILKINFYITDCGLIHHEKVKLLIVHGDRVHPPYLYPWMVSCLNNGPSNNYILS